VEARERGEQTLLELAAGRAREELAGGAAGERALAFERGEGGVERVRREARLAAE
jgi:hypothetical protein